MYYKLDCAFPMADDNTYYDIEDGLQFDGIKSWALGHTFAKSPPNPIIVPITKIGTSTDPIVVPSPFHDAFMCLATPDVVAAMKGCGVNSIDVYPAILQDTQTGVQFPYFAVNIIGIVKVADLDESEWTNLDGEAKMDTIFESLVIDSSRARNWDIFRMYEDTGTILISERVKRALEHIPFITFQPVPNSGEHTSP